MCDQSTLTTGVLVPDWITEQITTHRHLLNDYPDLYWATVFAYFAGDQSQWRTVQCLRDPTRPGVSVVGMAAVVPTLLDHHGLVPLIDSRQDQPLHPDYRHFPRARVDLLYAAFHRNVEFYRAFQLENQLSDAQYNAKEQHIPIDACNRVLVQISEFLRDVQDGATTGKTSYQVLHRLCLWKESGLFADWLQRRLHIDRQNQLLNYAQVQDGRRVQRFRLGFVMTILAQFRHVIGRMKGMAYDMERGINSAMDEKYEQHQLMDNRHNRLLYMASMIQLLYRSNIFVDQVGQLADAVGLHQPFIEYLDFIGVSDQVWGGDWPEAVEMAIERPQIDDVAIQVNLDYDGPHWILLRLISILPQQLTTPQFMDLFVDSMFEPFFRPVQREERLAQIVLVEDSNRLRAEVNGGVGNQVGQLDPLDVRAKIVWLLFMMPYLEQVGPVEFRLDQNPGGGGGAAGGGGGRGGHQNRPGEHGRGGQGQMPPHPPQYLNPGNFGPNYGNQWDNTGTDNQVRAMNGEIDGSEAKKLQNKDPNE